MCPYYKKNIKYDILKSIISRSKFKLSCTYVSADVTPGGTITYVQVQSIPPIFTILSTIPTVVVDVEAVSPLK